ncbi:MAG: hypothetical protein OEL77_03690 [Nitrosopumilus sp.]|nr:hypothetical protein [Nitrosopumilus sp.]MDH3385100.1 hypothetical protein [Nitrosopumilus sp.]
MVILSVDEIKKLDEACKKLLEEENIRHVGVINQLGNLIAGGFRKNQPSLLSDDKVRMVYMQMQLDYQMRQDLNDVLGPIDYIASRRKNQLIITVPIGKNLVLISAEPNSDDKKIIKRAEELFDDIKITSI